MMNEQLRDEISLDVLRAYVANPGLRAHEERMRRSASVPQTSTAVLRHGDHQLRYTGVGPLAAVEVRGATFMQQLCRSGAGSPFACSRRASASSPPKVDIAARTVDLSFSSEASVQRDFGGETLSHAPGAANLERLNSGAPLLFNHHMNDVIGVVQKAHIGSDRRGHATVRFAKSARGQETMDMVHDGILRNVSFMYSVDAVEESRSGGAFTVTKWTPMEISIVTVPADASVGIGRSAR
jgi:HK97 family phage prohead protease